ncbi:MAG: exodeoxyribonuclease VII small subunit [Flavobacteriales bacterium]
MSKPVSVKNFEKNLEQLEIIVDDLESGELSLEEALKQFEQGVKMTQACQQALTSAEQRVTELVEKNGVISLQDFDEETEA